MSCTTPFWVLSTLNLRLRCHSLLSLRGILDHLKLEGCVGNSMRLKAANVRLVLGNTSVETVVVLHMGLQSVRVKNTMRNDNGVMTNKQGGFRKGFSNTISIADVTDMLFANTDKNQPTIAVFVDLCKVFDTVDHEVLINKLDCYGIRGTNLLWCKNYLSNRLQRTLTNGILSSSADISCGVPQGSVLGPLFFILYINDAQAAIKRAGIQLYADDTVLYAADQNIRTATDNLQKALDQFTDWCGENKLTLNANKTKQMVFCTRNMVKKAKNVQLPVRCLPLQTVPTCKYLGRSLDSTLTLNYHVKNVSNMISYKAILLGKIRKFLTEKVALKIYKSMILPYFDYGDVIYNNTN